VDLVVGYRKAVGLGESISLDLIILDHLVNYTYLAWMRKRIETHYPDLVAATGLRFTSSRRHKRKKNHKRKSQQDEPEEEESHLEMEESQPAQPKIDMHRREAKMKQCIETSNGTKTA